MALHTRGYPPSREGAKSDALRDIIKYLDGRIGQSLKEKGPKLVHIEVDHGDAPEGSAEEEAAEPPDEAAAEGDVPQDDDAKKLLALAAKRGGKR